MVSIKAGVIRQSSGHPVWSRALYYTVCSQLWLYGGLLVCTLLLPHYLLESNEGGVSNYGVHFLTVIPFSLAFGLGGWYLLQSARSLPAVMNTNRNLKTVLLVIGWCLIAVLVTTYPYKLNRLLDDLHIVAAILLFSAELAAAAWFSLILVRDKLNQWLALVQAIGALLALLTLIGLIHILFICQIISGLAFAAILLRTISWVTGNQPSGAAWKL